VPGRNDSSKIWPEVQVVAQKQTDRSDSWPEGWESWPTVCPLLKKWVRSSAASNWPTRAAVEVHSDVANFLDYFLEASEILEPSVYGYCYDLEVSQGNMDGIKPFTTPEPRPPTPTPPPTAFPTIHVQNRSNAIAIYRINCGGGKFTDNAGHVWQADEYFNTGREDKKTDLKIVNVAPNDNQLYATNRFDMPGGKPLKYTLPVENDPNVSYLVRLHFCEFFFLTPDSRIFDVAINEQRVLKNFEIIKSVGAAFRAGVEEVVISPVTDRGNIQIDFIPLFENPLISGIEVYKVMMSR
jgi:Malectin domain